MNGKQFKNNVFAPTKKTQKNLSKIFFLSFQSMMKRLKHGSLVFAVFSPFSGCMTTFPTPSHRPKTHLLSKNKIQNQTSVQRTLLRNTLTKFWNNHRFVVLKVNLFKLTSFRKEISGVYCPSSLLLSFGYLQLIKHCLSHFLCHDQQCLEVL